MLEKSFVTLGPEGDTESFFNDKTQQLTLPFLSQLFKLKIFDILSFAVPMPNSINV